MNRGRFWLLAGGLVVMLVGAAIWNDVQSRSKSPQGTPASGPGADAPDRADDQKPAKSKRSSPQGTPRPGELVG